VHSADAVNQTGLNLASLIVFKCACRRGEQGNGVRILTWIDCMVPQRHKYLYIRKYSHDKANESMQPFSRGPIYWSRLNVIHLVHSLFGDNRAGLGFVKPSLNRLEGH